MRRRSPAGAAAMAAGLVGGGPGLVNDHETFRVQINPTIEPVVPPLQDIGPGPARWHEQSFFARDATAYEEVVKTGDRDGQVNLGEPPARPFKRAILTRFPDRQNVGRPLLDPA